MCTNVSNILIGFLIKNVYYTNKNIILFNNPPATLAKTLASTLA